MAGRSGATSKSGVTEPKSSAPIASDHAQLIIDAAARAGVSLTKADLFPNAIAGTIDRTFADKYAANGRMSLFHMTPAQRHLQELLDVQHERASALRDAANLARIKNPVAQKNAERYKAQAESARLKIIAIASARA